MYTDYEPEFKLDLPDHIIYDNVDPYEPTYKPDAPNFRSSVNSNVDEIKTETSHQMPPFPHSSYLKDGKRIYKFSRTNSDRERSKMWKDAADDVSFLIKKKFLFN